MNEFAQIWTSCTDMDEAKKIARSLLNDKLIACAKYLPFESDFIWQGKIDSSREVLLIMETRADLFAEVEQRIIMQHSYETPVIQKIEISDVNPSAALWLRSSIKK